MAGQALTHMHAKPIAAALPSAPSIPPPWIIRGSVAAAWACSLPRRLAWAFRDRAAAWAR